MSRAGETSWIERGAGPPVVFLHGYPLTHGMFGPEVEPISRNHRVLLVDLPGYGRAVDAPVPVDLRGFADRVLETLAPIVPGPFVLVGHSFGGYVALEIARRHSDRLRALVLTNTRSEPDDPAAKAKRLATAERLEDPIEHLDVPAVTRSLLAPASWGGGGPLVETVRSMVESVPSRTLVATLRAIADRPDLTPVLAEITVPTLVIWGDEDQLIPPAQTRGMLAHLRQGAGRGIPGAGHLPSLEAPAAFVAALEGFLATSALSSR